MYVLNHGEAVYGINAEHCMKSAVRRYGIDCAANIKGGSSTSKMKKFLISVKQSSVSGAGSNIRRRRNKTWFA